MLVSRQEQNLAALWLIGASLTAVSTWKIAGQQFTAGFWSLVLNFESPTHVINAIKWHLMELIPSKAGGIERGEEGINSQS
ncbi:hypothetical protein MA16_Dca009884 [Dendrobium catenatum]|uniref:Uncharacterized protein n=1 Tax=Dendrobium catenatum TaxID=906689 RepID=A0A2I0VKF0_9ASPA|nr:hypothetical protein MA16_Dca009884 [Dendrobium catenatum]